MRRKNNLFTWYYGSASIRKKLVISYLLLIAVPILVLGTYSYSVARKNFEDQTKNTMSNNVAFLTTDLNTSLKRENDNIKFLSYNIEFRQTLKLNGENRNPTEIAWVLNKVVEPTFWYFIASDMNIKGMEIYTPYVDYDIGSFLRTDRECRDEVWYQWHRTNFNTRWHCENRELYATRTILDARTSSELIGVLKLKLYPTRIFETLDEAAYLNNGLLLTDGQGNAIYSRGIGNGEIDGAVAEQARSGQPGGVDNGDYFLVTGEVANSGWRLYYYVDRREISGQLDEILDSTLVAAALCLGISLVLISVLSKILSKRILELKRSAEQVAEGNFSLDIRTDYEDEIGAVAVSLKSMSRRLSEMIDRVYKSELEKKAMELKALQAMINPHFLYNCLSSIKWKAMRSGNDEISDITGFLAKFYRTSLNGGRQITTVKLELENIRSYIELQSMTRDHDFEVRYEVQEECADCSMLNFLLQPLVENAIEHGLARQEGGGERLLIVRCRADGEFLLFQILNNGPRMDREHLEEVLRKPGKGYGIFNIRERIRIYYGERCGISVEITEEGYTCFTVKLLRELTIS